jgi:transcriptional regulator with XRE-family HTH domain
MADMDFAVLPQVAYNEAAGKRLRHLIDLLGISYVEAGRIMGVSKNVLRNWMAGDHPVSPYALYRLCAVKHVDFNYVFLDDWSRLPPALRDRLEAETLSQLEAASAHQDA